MSYALLLAKMMCTHHIEKNDTFNPLDEPDESVICVLHCMHTKIALLLLLIIQWTTKPHNNYSNNFKQEVSVANMKRQCENLRMLLTFKCLTFCIMQDCFSAVIQRTVAA